MSNIGRVIKSIRDDEEKELWYFSIIDVIEVLTGTNRPRKYWSDLKAKLAKEGSQLSDNIGQLIPSFSTEFPASRTLRLFL